MLSQVVGLVMQTASASPAPQSDPSVYAQYSSAVQVLPARAPQALGTGHARSVQRSAPFAQSQMLHPSPTGMLTEPSGYETPLSVHEPGGGTQVLASVTLVPAAAARQELS